MSISDKLLTIAENEQRVYDAGKQAEYDALWDSIQDYGKRTSYNFAFSGDMWTPETFKPKYPIQPTTCFHIFAYWGKHNTRTERFDFRGLPIDFSKSTSLINGFFDNKIIEAVGEVNVISSDNLTGIFSGATVLHTIEKFVLKPNGSNTFANAFLSCEKLENITFEGVIGNDISFGNSPLLTKESLMSILNHLKDFRGTNTTRTCTLGTTNLAKLTDAEKAIGTEKGWSLA